MFHLVENFMNKKTVALFALGLSGSVAYAQSSVTMYGVVDTGFIKETGRDIRMGDNDNNRLGFRGTEDLGNGLKAIFNLEKRFDLNDGTAGNSNTASYKGSKNAKQKDFDGPTFVGLASNDWGQVQLGRVNELSTETIRKFDPFNQIGIGSQIYSVQRNARIDNTVRYNSPKWSGFSFGASYSLGGNTKGDNAIAPSLVGADNDGYGINLSYDNGAFSTTANWSRVADSNDSHVWNIGLGYRFTPGLKLSASYEDTNGKGWKGGNGAASGTATNPSGYSDSLKAREKNLLVGLAWNVGPGRVDGSVQYNRLKDTSFLTGTADSYKYALGYTYFLSKRTSLYGFLAYTDYDDKATGNFYSGLERDSVTGVQVGMTHRF